MEEVITLDGRQFRLTTNRPLTILEKEQAIADIKKQTSTITNLGRIQTLVQTCATITMLAPANITVTDITIGTVDCVTGPTCPDLVCTNAECEPSESVTVVVTFENSGDVNGSIIPTLTVNGGIPIDPTETTPITVPKATGTPPAIPGTATATFTDVPLARGENNVCVNW